MGYTMPKLAKGLKAKKGGVLEGDLGRAAINGWLAGSGFPNVIQLAEICRRLDISADALVFGSQAAASPQLERAAQALKDLSEEERAAIRYLLDRPGVGNERVGKFIRPAPPHDLDSRPAELEGKGERDGE